MPFKPGPDPNRALGGARPGAGRLSKTALNAKAAALAVWEAALAKNESAAAKRYASLSTKDVKVLLDRRKITVPDAKQEISLSGDVTVRIVTFGNKPPT